MPEFPSREELILQSIINGTEYNGLPKSRVEYLLLQLKAAIEGLPSDYTELENKPQINSVTLVGNKTLSDLGIINPMMMMGRVDTVATLPEIPTTTGQNTLTVDTVLAPSNLTIKGHIKAITT